MRIPLHLKQNDYSPQSCAKRVELQAEMARLNPNGFRDPPKRKSQKMRNEFLAEIAGMY